MQYDVAFLGGLFPKETENEIKQNSKSSVQNAANLLQWKLVRGLDENLEKPVKIINSLYVGSFPKKYKKIFVKTYNFSHAPDACDINVGFCNIAGIKHILRNLSIRPHLKRWAKSNSEGKKKILIAYALTNAFVQAIKYIKKINPDITTCIVVPDLPQYMNTSSKSSFLYNVLKAFDIKNMKKSFKYIDCFVLLTKQMNEEINAEKYVVVEGVATKEQHCFEVNKSEYKTVLYSGELNRRYGTMNLVDAFMQIDNPDYRMIICGRGECEKDIVKAAEKDSRIIFKGLTDNKEVLRLQMESTIVVNPRQNNEEFTKFSFPSKNLEYLSSGTPLIAYKLDGIPDEYDNYIYYVDGDSVVDLKNKMVEVCEKSAEELLDFGGKAKQFVLENKNAKKQTKKILDMLAR